MSMFIGIPFSTALAVCLTVTLNRSKFCAGGADDGAMPSLFAIIDFIQTFIISACAILVVHMWSDV